MPRISKVVITGASGFVGAAIALRLESSGFQVVELGRRPSGNTQREFFKWELGEPIPPAAFYGTSTLVHCAWDFLTQTPDESWRVNVLGSGEILRAFESGSGRRAIFISSLSAGSESASLYGRHKNAVEKVVRGIGGHIVRPGLIWSSHSRGLVGSIQRLIALSPIVPIPTGSVRNLYPCPLHDVAETVFSLISIESSESKIVAVGEIEARSLLEIAKCLRGKTNCLLVSVNWRFFYWVLKLKEIFLGPGRIRSDSLLIFKNRSTPKEKDTNWIGTTQTLTEQHMGTPGINDRNIKT